MSASVPEEFTAHVPVPTKEQLEKMLLDKRKDVCTSSPPSHLLLSSPSLLSLVLPPTCTNPKLIFGIGVEKEIHQRRNVREYQLANCIIDRKHVYLNNNSLLYSKKISHLNSHLLLKMRTLLPFSVFATLRGTLTKSSCLIQTTLKREVSKSKLSHPLPLSLDALPLPPPPFPSLPLPPPLSPDIPCCLYSSLF